MGFISDKYFDLVNDSIDKIIIKENSKKNGCFITNKGISHSIYKGFKLTNKPRVNNELYPEKWTLS